MSFSKRPDVDAVCYTKPLDSLKRWNDHFFWVDSFACPASFPWHAYKNVSRDPFPKSTEFRADDYAILVAHPAPFRKFPEPFLCLIRMSRNYTLDEDTYPTFYHDVETEMDLFAFIQVADPTKVKVGEWERAKGEARLLDSTVGRVVSLLPVAPARTESELEASVERLFDEGGSADQGDFAAGGGHDAKIESSTGVRIIAAENVTAERPKRSCKKRQAVTDAGELLASNMLNVEAGVAAVATFLMVTSSMSDTPKHESGPPIDSIIGLNLRTLGLTERFVISSDSSHHSSTNAAEAGINSFVRSVTPPPVMTEAVITTNVASIPSAPAPEAGTKVVTPVHALMFHDSDSTRTVKMSAAGSSHVPGKELSMGSQDVNSETLHEVFIPQWNVSNDTLLDDHDVSHEFIDHLAPPVLFAQIREMDYHHLFTKFNVGTDRQACDLLKVRDAEIESLKAQLLLKETEAAEAVNLRAQVFAAEATEKMHASEIDALKQKNVALENKKGSHDGKVVELHSSVSTKDLELKELNAVMSSLRDNYHGEHYYYGEQLNASHHNGKITVVTLVRELCPHGKANRISSDPDISCQNLGGWNTSIYETCGLWAYHASAAPL
ncbi:hypothetical protein Tco_0928701 [Tanacetum coccineum]